jgi:hypothetical protein
LAGADSVVDVAKDQKVEAATSEDLNEVASVEVRAANVEASEVLGGLEGPLYDAIPPISSVRQKNFIPFVLS